MNQDELLKEIAEYLKILRSNAEGDALLVRELGKNEATAAMILPLKPSIERRQRDYAIMLRMMTLVEDDFLAGKDWMARHRELWSFKNTFEASYEPLDSVLMPMYQALMSS